MTLRHWQIVNKFDPRAASLADLHYSRRTIGSPQFMPPGQTIVSFSRLTPALSSAGGVRIPTQAWSQ